MSPDIPKRFVIPLLILLDNALDTDVTAYLVPEVVALKQQQEARHLDGQLSGSSNRVP